MSTPIIPWTIEITGQKTQLKVGIWEHEREFQPIHVNLTIRAILMASPKSIEDCLNYQPICEWLRDEWPKQPHTLLLETRMRELLTFVFDFDSRIEWVDASISKPTAFVGTQAVGVRLAISRADFGVAFNSDSARADGFSYRVKSVDSLVE